MQFWPGVLQFLEAEEAATAVEYAVMLAFILVVCIGTIRSIGTQTADMYDPNGELTAALGASGS